MEEKRVSFTDLKIFLQRMVLTKWLYSLMLACGGRQYIMLSTSCPQSIRLRFFSLLVASTCVIETAYRRDKTLRIILARIAGNILGMMEWSRPNKEARQSGAWLVLARNRADWTILKFSKGSSGIHSGKLRHKRPSREMEADWDNSFS